LQDGTNGVTIQFSDGSSPCKSWLADYTLTFTIVYGLALFISALNSILREALYYLSYFERPHTQTEQLEAASSKMWTVMFFNSGLVVLLINANYLRVPLPANSPVLRGPY
jgi:hypothetical protein